MLRKRPFVKRETRVLSADFEPTSRSHVCRVANPYKPVTDRFVLL